MCVFISSHNSHRFIKITNFNFFSICLNIHFRAKGTTVTLPYLQRVF